MTEMPLGSRIRASGRWAAIGRLLSGVLLLGLHSILARVLSGASYGQYVIIESLALLFSIVCMAGMPYVTLRLARAKLVEGDAAGASQVVRSACRLLSLTAPLTILVASILCVLFGKSVTDQFDWYWVPWFCIWAVLAAGLRVVSEMYRAFDSYSVAYCIGGQNGGLLVNFGLVALSLVAVVLGHFTLTTILILQIVIQAVFLALAVAGLKQHLVIPERSGSGSSIRMLLMAGWPVLALHLMTIGLPESGKLLLGMYSSPRDAGLYNAAARLVLLADVPLMLISIAIQPFIPELFFGGRKEELRTLARGSATVAAVPCFALLAVFLFVPEIVLHYAFGPEFTQASDALRILALGSLIWGLTGSCGMVLTLTGHERSSMFGTLMPGVVFLVLCPILIKEYGCVGAAACTAGLRAGSNLICLALVYYHHKISTAASLSRPVVQSFIRMVLHNG